MPTPTSLPTLFIAAVAAVAAGAAACSKKTTVRLPSPETGVQEYVIPWENAFPSDIAVDSAGKVWFTDRIAHVIGRFDPDAGEFASFRPPTAKSSPYGLIVAPDGGLWYAASRAGLLGRIDPATGRIVEHRIPGAQGGPQLLAWLDGTIWFSLREWYAFGRYDTRTGETRIFSVEERQRPYAVAVAPDGHVWFDVLDGWFLYEVDPATDAFRLHDISESPRPGQPWGYVRMIDDNGHQRYRELRDSSEVAQLPDSLRSRISRFRVRGAAKRMALDARGNVWLTDWGRDRVVRYDPERGALTEYPSLPRPAEPYGIAVRSTGEVWYSEKGNGWMVALDPETGERSRIAIPTTTGTIRQFFFDEKRGRVWLPLSDAGMLAVITLTK